MEQRAGLGWPQEPEPQADDESSAGLGWPEAGEDA